MEQSQKKENRDEASFLSSLQAVAALREEGHLEAGLTRAMKLWIEYPGEHEAIKSFGEALQSAGDEMQEIASSIIAFSKLFEGKEGKENWNKPLGERTARQLFEIGYKLIDMRMYELAAVLLIKCLDDSPHEANLHYEIGFTLMNLGRYDEAIRHFEFTNKTSEDFDSTLNLAVCFSLTRQLRKAKKFLAKLENMAIEPAEKLEAIHRKLCIQRLDQLRWKAELGDRDWMYALYGSMLACSSESPNHRSLGKLFSRPNEPPQQTEQRSPVKHGYNEIARTLIIVKGILDGLCLTPEAIEFYSTSSRPLAAVLSRLMDVPMDSYRGPDRPDHAMLVLDWAPEIIGPHDVFRLNGDNRSIFAYALPQDTPLPLVPDLVGHLLDEIELPWIKRTTAGGFSTPSLNFGKETNDAEIDPDEAIPSILELAWNLESDPAILKYIQDTVQFFQDKLDFIVFSNEERFKQRPEFSAEIP